MPRSPLLLLETCTEFKSKKNIGDEKKSDLYHFDRPSP